MLRTDDERKHLALFLYERLRTAPPFRFAVVGVECHEFDPFDRAGALYPFDGLVVSEQLFGTRPASPENLNRLRLGIFGFHSQRRAQYDTEQSRCTEPGDDALGAI